MQNKLFPARIRFHLHIPAWILSAVLISACSFPGVYKINVQQGNIITQEMLDKLKPGMNKRQVHFVLGNPVLTNVFDRDHETYLYTYQLAGGETQQQKIMVYYKDQLFERYEGTVLEEHPAY
ncbi:MAG: outer membrane protein assembly factor BamE [Oleiphilus sp.]|nr:MAG: outer membrane protein assembly factor BamE [Oleiphilus sp.]